MKTKTEVIRKIHSTHQDFNKMFIILYVLIAVGNVIALGADLVLMWLDKDSISQYLMEHGALKNAAILLQLLLPFFLGIHLNN